MFDLTWFLALDWRPAAHAAALVPMLVALYLVTTSGHTEEVVVNAIRGIVWMLLALALLSV